MIQKLKEIALKNVLIKKKNNVVKWNCVKNKNKNQRSEPFKTFRRGFHKIEFKFLYKFIRSKVDTHAYTFLIAALPQSDVFEINTAYIEFFNRINVETDKSMFPHPNLIEIDLEECDPSSDLITKYELNN